MKRKITKLLILSLLMAVSFGLRGGTSALAQSDFVNAKLDDDNVKREARMTYHNGRLMLGSSDVFVIWYGCWEDNCGSAGSAASRDILVRFLENIGATPYFQINAFYSDFHDLTPSSALFFGGEAIDHYSRGVELTEWDIQGIIADQLLANRLPQDPHGIYLVVASADVGSLATGFCTPSGQPHHGRGDALGLDFIYGFVGNPVRCPTVAAPQFMAADGSLLPTPNGSLAADAMASTMAHLLDVIVTNPNGTGWFDSYGMENADKCVGTFGPTYTTPNGARANLRLGQRHYLIQQNWVNVQPARDMVTFHFD